MSQSLATLLLTRPKDACQSFLDQYSHVLPDRVDVVVSPLLAIVPTGNLPDLSGKKGVIFTSVNGVEFGGPGCDLPAFCVGETTTSVALEKGWNAECRGTGSDMLVQSLTKYKPVNPLLHIGGVHRRGNVAKRLADAGVETANVDVYDQALCNLNDTAREALSGEHPVIVPLFSPRTARQFAKDCSGSAPLCLIAMSNAILDEVESIEAVSRDVAGSPDAGSMVASIVNVLRRVEAGGAAQ